MQAILRTCLKPAVAAAAVWALAAGTDARAADEAGLVAVVRSSAGTGPRCEACRELLAVGSAECIPALVEALRDERVGHAALQTLERMEIPEAAAALRQAATTATGPVRIGVIDAIGWRGGEGAVDVLGGLLVDPTPAVAAAAARSLGRIASPQAAAALDRGLTGAGPALRAAILEALLPCAEVRLRAGDTAGAVAIYGRISGGECPRALRAAALRGLLVADGQRRDERLLEAVSSPDRATREVALGLLPELAPGPGIDSLVAGWESLSPAVRSALLGVHRMFPDQAPRLAIAAVADQDAAVRLAALRVMGELADASLVPVLAGVAAAGGKPEQLAARIALARIDGPGVDAAIRDCLEAAAGAERAELERALVARGGPQAK